MEQKVLPKKLENNHVIKHLAPDQYKQSEVLSIC